MDSKLQLFPCPGYLFSLIRVYLSSSVVSFASGAGKKIAASVPSQGVVLGWNAVPRCMTAQPGGMSADILLAHIIAAARVRRQFP
jgi:hypothetical protein